MNWTAIANYLAANWLEDAGVVTTLVRHLAHHAPQAHLLAGGADLRRALLDCFLSRQLYSDALLQIFFLAFTLYGWWYWWRGVREEGEVRVVRLPCPACSLVWRQARSEALRWAFS